MDADERALMAAIIANPEEDTPRLVYADWLQENGRPERAEYIRLSVELANLRYGVPEDEKRYWQLRAVRDRLVERFHKTWEAEFAAGFPPNRDINFIFRRGLVEGVLCSVKYFLDNADALFRAAPLRTFCPFSLSATTARQLVRSPHLVRLRGLYTIRADAAFAVTECASVPLRALDFSQPVRSTRGLWDRVAEMVAAHQGLGSVKFISFEDCGIGNLAGACLADARHIEPEALNLLGHNLEERVGQALRDRYGPRVWLDEADRAGTPRRGWN